MAMRAMRAVMVAACCIGASAAQGSFGTDLIAAICNASTRLSTRARARERARQKPLAAHRRAGAVVGIGAPSQEHACGTKSKKGCGRERLAHVISGVLFAPPPPPPPPSPQQATPKSRYTLTASWRRCSLVHRASRSPSW